MRRLIPLSYLYIKYEATASRWMVSLAEHKDWKQVESLCRAEQHVAPQLFVKILPPLDRARLAVYPHFQSLCKAKLTGCWL